MRSQFANAERAVSMQATPISVELVGHYGGDTEHALSAWTSTHRELTDERRARIPAMLKQLAENEHHTPFEKSTLHFLVVCDRATHIHLLKHRIGVSINAESARYKELREDRIYTPDDWPGAVCADYEACVSMALVAYHRLLENLVAAGVPRGRAKESARFVLPMGNAIVQDVSFNFRSFMHFVGLRADAHAQREVRIVAAKMLLATATTSQFNASLDAFGWGREKREALYTELNVRGGL